MVGLVDSTTAKLARAEETTQVLIKEIDEFLQANPSPYQISGELRNGTRYVFTASGRLDIPPRFSVLFGEIMHQLRTSLDHLLFALIVANGSMPTDRQQFPIASTPQKFTEAVKRGDIAGVSASAQALIEAIQPYQPTQPNPPLLSLLRDWNNADKHRLLVVVGAAAAIGNRLTIEETDGNVTITGMTPPFVRPVAIAGSDVFTIDLGEPHARFRATAEFVPEVAIPDVGSLEAASVREVASKMVLFIRQVVDNFSPEFSSSP